MFRGIKMWTFDLDEGIQLVTAARERISAAAVNASSFHQHRFHRIG